MNGMRNMTVCWAPECGNVVPPPRRGAPGRYCSSTCRVRALRRNGGKAPSEPYPPLEPGVTLAVSEAPPDVKQGEPRKRSPRSRPVSQPPQTAVNSDPRGRTVPAGGVHAPSDSAESGTPATVTQLHVTVTEDSTIPVEIRVNPMVAAYRADLERIGQATSRQGLQVIEMAEKLVSSATSPAAAANLSKELERLMSAVESTSTQAQALRDPSLVIRERTLAKLRAVESA